YCSLPLRHLHSFPTRRSSDLWVHVDGPYIAMTFDDGPSAKLTPKLLDLLAAHHIKATFFVLGENVAQNPAIVERAAREGHEIAKDRKSTRLNSSHDQISYAVF